MDSSNLEILTQRISDSLPKDLLRDPLSTAQELARRWSECHRVWHGPDHLLSLISQFEREPEDRSRVTLLLAAVFHDAIYDPGTDDNEEQSADLMFAYSKEPADPVVMHAGEIIRDSKWNKLPTDPLTYRFWEADSSPLSPEFPLHARLAYERAVFREYQFAPWALYLEKRTDFLRKWARQFPQHTAGVNECLALLSGLVPRVALYPGSFNPFHLGHLSTLRQAERMFDKVMVGIAVNRQKPGAVETLKLRCEELRSRLRFHEVVEIGGLLTDFIASHPLPVSVVRGVRDGIDLEAELRYARFLNELRPGTGVVWIGCEAELQHLSSSAIRELESISPGAGSRYVPTREEIYRVLE